MSASPSTHAVELRDLRVMRGGRTTLAISRLTLPAGELCAIVGPNGAGKSTLLRVINGLLPAARGEVIVLGCKLDGGTALEIRRRCALVFQDPLLLHQSVFDNVALGPRFRRYDRARVEQQVKRALRAFRCEHLASRAADRLSGGEVQRVCLARALVCEPELVMLDEPFAALDSPTRSALVQELREIAVARGTTAILVTHDFDDVLRFADRAIVLQDGRVVQDATPQEVLFRPANEQVAHLVAMDNVIPCVVALNGDETTVRLPNGMTFSVPGDLRGKVACCLAGDAVVLDDTADAPISMDGTVAHIVPGIGLTRLAVACGEVRIVALLTSRRRNVPKVGSRVRVAFDPSRIHFV